MSKKHLIDITSPDHYITRDGRDVLMIRKVEGDNLHFPLMVIFGDDTYASYETVTKYGEAHSDCESPNDILLRPEFQQKQAQENKKRKFKYKIIPGSQHNIPIVLAFRDDGKIFMSIQLNCHPNPITSWESVPEPPQN